MIKKLRVCSLVMFALCNVQAYFPEMQKKDLDEIRTKVDEVKGRAQHLMTNPIFFAVLTCICYLGPKNVAQDHPLLSIMGVGCVFAYLKGDAFVDIEGAEVKVRLLKGKGLKQDEEAKAA